VLWLWILLAVVLTPVMVIVFLLILLFIHLYINYFQYLERIFQEKPLFIIPRGQPDPRAEEVWFPTSDGLRLRGCYLRAAARQRRGVILFGLEFGSNRWASVPYCKHLLDQGFDVFAFEPRGQGDSEVQPGYEPLQWISDHEVRDMQAALAYLKGRPDADADGVGFFGVSKGGGAGLLAACRDPYVRCFVTDGVFATYTTMVPYMRKWISLYSRRYWLQVILPSWYYGLVGRACLKRLERQRHCRFLDLEPAFARLAPRPLLMIHGGADTYIKPDMARALFARARQPKEFWLVDGAKHNQAIHVAGEAYHQRILAFFQAHVAKRGEPLANGEVAKTDAGGKEKAAKPLVTS
jgi:pimeloyl-ACP methyl ester carboxylesterase